MPNPWTGRQRWADCGFGVGASVVGFLATLGLNLAVGETYFTLIIAAVAFVCWRRGWRAGLVSTASGLFAVALLLPPVFSLTIDSAGDVLRLGIFALTAGLVCGLAAIGERTSRRLRIAERNWRDSERWLATAQQLARFWTWELDPERRLVRWANPYGELKSQEYAPLESCLLRVHPEDRARWRSAIAEAATTDVLDLDFRVSGPEGEHHLVARGVVAPDGASGRRFVGISAEVRTDGETETALRGLEDLLVSLQDNSSLDRRARLNLGLAREVVRNVLAAGGSRA